MTLSSDISTTSTALSDIKQAIIAKGVTPSGNITTYATAISNINTVNNTTLSVIPTTSAQNLTPSSPYTGYGSVTVAAVTSSIDANITAGNIKKDVQILGVTGTYEGGGGIGIPREVKNGVYQMPTTNFTFSLPSNATNVGKYGLYYAFNDCTALTSVDLSSLTTVSGTQGLYYAFNGCTALTSVDLSSLTTVSGSEGFRAAFLGTKLTSVDLSSLTTVSGTQCFSNAFQNCTRLTSLNLSSLTTVSGTSSFTDTFRGCTALTSVDLSSLTTVSGSKCLSSAFNGCTGLTDIYFRALTTSSFGSYKNQFDSMLSSTGSTKTHTIHFPSNLQSKISGLTGYPNFGGKSGYVTLSFDLPAT